MAKMYNMAQDWTYDMYVQGIRVNDSEDEYNRYFSETMRHNAEEFLENWKREHDGKLYDHGWVGDAYASTLSDWFSDFYKEAYGQRPHLPIWYYVNPLGLPMREDTARTFCAEPIEEAMESAQWVRDHF